MFAVQNAGLTYTDRGDISVDDFDLSDFIVDGAWHNLDLPDFVPNNAKAVLMLINVKATTTGQSFRVCPYTYTSRWGKTTVKTSVATQDLENQAFVPMIGGKKIQYRVDTGVDITAEIHILGWWT